MLAWEVLASSFVALTFLSDRFRLEHFLPWLQPVTLCQYGMQCVFGSTDLLAFGPCNQQSAVCISFSLVGCVLPSRFGPLDCFLVLFGGSVLVAHPCLASCCWRVSVQLAGFWRVRLSGLWDHVVLSLAMAFSFWASGLGGFALVCGLVFLLHWFSEPV